MSANANRRYIRAMIAIRRAAASDVDHVAPLFDAYRQFYRQPSDLDLARRYLADRLAAGESVILVAETSGTAAPEACGFTQLYPLFSSIACRPVWILSDLFVARAFRRGGVGRQLMESAHVFARQTGAATVELDTAHTNTSAQALYESLGYRRDQEFRHYVLTL
jgi:ribosomal protein S18 acetylase RimI-like enzyme